MDKIDYRKIVSQFPPQKFALGERVRVLWRQGEPIGRVVEFRGPLASGRNLYEVEIGPDGEGEMFEVSTPEDMLAAEAAEPEAAPA